MSATLKLIIGLFVLRCIFAGIPWWTDRRKRKEQKNNSG